MVWGSKAMKNIILIYPPKKNKSGGYSDVPLSLLYLSGSVRNLCEQVIIFDFNIEGNNLKSLDEAIKKANPFLIGINCLFSGVFSEVLNIANHIKDANDNIKIVIGGIHPTIFGNEIMRNCPSIDAIVIGEGDISFPKLLNYYMGGGG